MRATEQERIEGKAKEVRRAAGDPGGRETSGSTTSRQETAGGQKGTFGRSAPM